jgi:hypothetical protein
MERAQSEREMAPQSARCRIAGGCIALCFRALLHLRGRIVDFQLLPAVPSLPLPLPSRSAARLDSAFFPDAWQRRMLNILDRNESAFVVGPTSAGKTVIHMDCSNAIHKHHNSEATNAKKRHAGNNSLLAKVLIYVSPTKALVNRGGVPAHGQPTSHLPARATSKHAPL